MQPGEIIVAKLAKGPCVAKYVRSSKLHVTVSLPQNTEAYIPRSRILFKTGKTISTTEELQEFWKQCENLSSQINLKNIWEITSENPSSTSIKKLTELNWGPNTNTTHEVALVLHMERGQEYFKCDGDSYLPKSRESVLEMQKRKEQKRQNIERTSIFIRNLLQGNLPQEITGIESELLHHIREYAIYGTEYQNNQKVHQLLGSLDRNTRDLQQYCFDLLVSAGLFSTDEPIEIHRAGITSDFSENVLRYTNTLKEDKDISNSQRKDLTSLPTITIDDIETLDRDDALSIVADPDTSQIHQIAIHITDISNIIQPHSPLDSEARKRMATIYLPEGEIDMLPSNISHDIGSLQEGKTRNAISILIYLSNSGEVSNFEIVSSVIQSDASLTYTEVDIALEKPNHKWYSTLNSFKKISELLRKNRESAGAINIDRMEMAIKLTPEGEVKVRTLQRSSPGRILVSEFMILYNSLLATFCQKEKIPTIYRFQDIQEVDQTIPVSSRRVKNVVQSQGNHILRNFLLSKQMLPAELTLTPSPHSGLGVKSYTQATSPLRRYTDLVAQRQVSHYIARGNIIHEADMLIPIAREADRLLRDLSRIEEDRKRYWFLKFLLHTRLLSNTPDCSNLFNATVLENEYGKRGLVELTEFPFRTRTSLRQNIQPGEIVELSLTDVDLWHRSVYFVLRS